MKTIISIICVIICAISAISAQTVMNPNTDPPKYFIYPAKSAVTYYRNKVDTASPSGAKLGGASFLSFYITNTDTLKALLSFDYKYVGSTQWNTGFYTDSVQVVVPDTNEIKIRVPGTDRLGKILASIRAIITQQSTAGYDSSQTFNAGWVWKP